VSVENILGLAATLDSLGQKAEMSSTAYSKLMTTMTKKTGEFAKIANMDLAEFSRLLSEDANEAMIRVFESLNKNSAGFDQLVAALGDLGIEGQRMTSVFGAMANNTDLLREQQALANEAFREGTSLTDEFNIKNNTAQANLEKALKNFAQMRRELGEKLIPAYTSVISKSRLLLKFLSSLIDIVAKYGRTIIVSTAAIVGYTIALKAAANWTKIKGIYTATVTGLQKAYAFSTGVLTGKIKLATVAQKAWNLAQKANPIGLLAGLVSGAVVALAGYIKKARNTAEEQKKLNEELQRTEDILGRQQYEQFLKDIGIYTDKVITLADGSQKVIKSFNENINVLDKFGEKVKSLRQNELENFKQFFEDEIINIQRRLKTLDPDSLQFATDSSKVEEYKEALALVNGELQNISESRKKLEDDGSELIPVDFEAAKEALQSAFNQEQNILKQQFLEKKLTQAEFNREMYSLELAHLSAMRELYRRHGEDFIAIEGQIVDKKLAWQSQLDKMLETSVQLTKSITEDERKMFADIDKEMDKHLEDYTKNLDKGTQAVIEAKIKEKEAYEAAREAAIFAAVESGMAAVENAETAEEAGRAILNVIRDQIRAYLAEAVAAQVTKILETVPPPLSLILAAVAGGATAAAFNMIVPKFYAGGYTSPGSKMEPAGIVHAGEYVVPQEGLENPQVKQLVDVLELARRAGNLRHLDLSPIINILPQKGFSQGGFASKPAVTSPPVGGDFSQQTEKNEIDQKTFDRLIKAIERFEKKRLVVYTETFKKDLETLDEIEKQRGL
jgi:hypothetical protein